MLATPATLPMHRTISQDQADAIVQLLGYDGLIEDSETFADEREYRYFLMDPSNILVIGFDGSAKMVDADGAVLDRQAFIDFEEIGEYTVRYWHGHLDCGTVTF